MSTTQATNTSPPIRSYGPRTLFVAAVFCGFLGFFYWLYYYLSMAPVVARDNTTANREANVNSPGAKSLIVNPQEAPTQSPENSADWNQQIQELAELRQEVTEKLSALQATATGSQIEQDVRLARISSVRREGEEIRENLVALKTEHAAWEIQLASLMSDDRGRQVAANPVQLQLVDTILNQNTLTKTRISGWEEELDLRMRTIRSAAIDADATITIPSQFLEELDAFGETIRKSLQELRQQQASLGAILAGVKSTSPESGQVSLKEALARYREQRAKDVLVFRAQQSEKIREEYKEKLAQEIQKTESKVGEAKLVAEQEKRKQQLQEIDTSKEIEIQKSKDREVDAKRAETKRQEELAAKRKREDLEKEFAADLPKIKLRLIPFLQDGFNQPPFGMGKNDGKKGPVSYSKLQAAGCLIEGGEGLNHLTDLALSPWNDRPNGGFRRGYGGRLTAENTPYVVTAQQYLIKYGPLMVEKGMLAP